MTWREIVTEQLSRHEGVRPRPYLDTEGKTTIGIGRNLTDKPLRLDEIDYLFRHDLADAEEDARTAIGDAVFEALSDARKAVLVNMAFNLGLTRLRKFKDMIASVKAGQWQEAKAAMLDSRWAQQVGTRATELADLMVRGS
jgi:lysozyme